MAEINVVSEFRWDPKQSASGEINLMKKKVWEPTTVDFLANAPGSYTCTSFLQMLGVIAVQQVGTVDRLNIFSHGNPDQIAFKGRVQPGAYSSTVYFESVAGEVSHLDTASLAVLRDPTRYYVVGAKRFTFADIKKRFTSKAVIFIYSCRSGAVGSFVQDIADTFKVMVVNGFTKKIGYCPQYTGTLIDRKHMTLADVANPCYTSPSRTTSYYTLAPYAATRGMILSRSPRP